VKRVLVGVVTGILILGTHGYAEEQAGNAGADAFRKCMACHQVGPSARNGVGPVLNGSIGRPAGTHPGYNYSAAMRNSGLVWDEQTLTRYLRAPREVVPGTRMAFAGLKDDQELAAVIAYLKRFDEEGRSIN
jgi:cytochrome c